MELSIASPKSEVFCVQFCSLIVQKGWIQDAKAVQMTGMSQRMDRLPYMKIQYSHLFNLVKVISENGIKHNTRKLK